MVPSLKVPKNALRDNGFINGYIQDAERDIQYENAVYILFQPEDILKFREFLDEEYERTQQVIEDYDYDGGYVVVVYKLDKKWNEDFNLVKKGKYSRTSADFQKMFPKVIKIKKNGLHRDEISLQYRIFKRTNDMVEYWENKLGVEWDDNMEVWDGYDEEKEILHINKLKEKLTLEKTK